MFEGGRYRHLVQYMRCLTPKRRLPRYLQALVPSRQVASIDSWIGNGLRSGCIPLVAEFGPRCLFHLRTPPNGEATAASINASTDTVAMEQYPPIAKHSNAMRLTIFVRNAATVRTTAATQLSSWAHCHLGHRCHHRRRQDFQILPVRESCRSAARVALLWVGGITSI